MDDIGLVNHITGIISADMSVDMRKVSFETNAGTFEGRIEVMVNDTEHLGELLDRLRRPRRLDRRPAWKTDHEIHPWSRGEAFGALAQATFFVT